MIRIAYGKSRSDATSEYFITTDNETVGEFITEWLETNPNEWGIFRVAIGERYFDFPKYDYKRGQLITEIPEKYLKRKIKRVTGDGGWSRSDFIFY